MVLELPSVSNVVAFVDGYIIVAVGRPCRPRHSVISVSSHALIATLHSQIFSKLTNDNLIYTDMECDFIHGPFLYNILKY